ncbi:sugar ABC transporter ATP-binding protein [Advenella sp. S44]|uniref:ABC transporter ATP-binding protein n=1 Tax=Advenella sp. S44 TaxID=1982755 RepID=UPI000C2AFBA3|nr:ABC transporter ATP-binding protein [Advenella sp. S44]PJX25517.1 sugar ABC transporter ATP-binding protein [Advenella sp. S44]
MSSEVSISVRDIGKCYHIYNKPSDRLKQMLLRGKRKYYNEFWALRQTSFEIMKGETVGIIGRNGSGKSTLLQMICGTVAPTEGACETHGRVAALLELGAGFNPEFTGRENIFLNAAILGLSDEATASKMPDILSFSELEGFIDQPVKTYSSGMFARLAFSIAIHVDPEILIIDEALSVGDARFVAKCMKKIKDIQSKGATILFVSHDVGSVRTLCDRAIWIDKGVLIDDGKVFPVTGRYTEYLFKDGDANVPTALDPASAGSFDIDNGKDSQLAERHVGSKAMPNAKITLDSRPVTHWGSHTGLISSASVCDENNERKDLHYWGENIKVHIELNIPESIDRNHLSVAFSIKDLKGNDLIVSTTQDFSGKKLPEQNQFTVTCSFENYLTSGKYLLVAAVENREYHDIHYYEYIEGAHYFSVLDEAKLFGKFQPRIKQTILAR